MRTVMLRWVLLLLVATPFSLLGQTAYYWSDGQKIDLLENRAAVMVHLAEGVSAQTASIRSLDARPEISAVDVFEQKHRAVLHFDQIRNESAAELPRMLGLTADQVRSVSYGWQLDDGFEVFHTHEVVLQMYKNLPFERLQPIMDQYGATFLRRDFDNYILDVADIDQVVALANDLQESGLVRFATPDLYAELTHYADPLYGDQFQMNNTGQTIDGFAGTNDMDCNAPEAWGITLGSSSITVAVIDDGLEAHEDFVTSGGASRVLGGNTPATGGNGTPGAAGDHGVACAGIIAASHNNLGVQGLAPNVFMRSVNIFAGGETANDIANGITWAKNQGVDVMSNSWGYTSCTFSNSAISNAISDAINNGRGGLGCVVVFASGNGYKTCVDFPANLSTVIAVGAFGNDGIKSEYSNSGSALDIAAPSNDISSAGFLVGAGVRTTDRMGSAGYGGGNYTNTFGGTSAACPVVAGVAALVLSVNPNLTDAQVKNILYTTANDMGASGFDNLYGNGRVDAFGAVQAAGGGGGGPSCSSTVSSFPYSESFESGIGGWTQGSGDDFDWTNRSGTTPSSGTGPSGASDGTFYMYMETSSPNFPTRDAYFESPCFDISGISSPEFSFQYHMLGSAVGTLRLQASTDGSSWTTVWSESGDQGSAWSGQTVSLSAYAGASELRLRFFGTSGTSWQGDMCIDALSLTGGFGGGGGCTENEVTLTIVLDNYPAETTWSLTDAGGSTVASGGPYTGAGSTVTEDFCLPDGCYDFTINDSYGDGICCAYGNGSYLLTDAGGSTLASGGAFTSSETTNFCVGSGPAPCPTIDFNSYTVTAYGNGQDNGSSAIQNGGATLFLQNNAWKDITFNYAVTANTVLEFDFRSTLQGEIHGIGFDTDEGISSNRTFKVHGTQNWGITNYDNYSGSSWTTYTIPVGSFYTGSFSKLFFVADHDGGAQNGNAYFRNVKVYESGACGSSIAASDMGQTREAIMGNEAEGSFNVFPNPANDLLNVSFGTAQESYEFVIFDAAGRLVDRQQLTGGLQIMNVSDLTPGVYMLKVKGTEASAMQKFVISR